METQDAPFEIVYQQHTLKVETLRIGKSVLYKITNEQKPGVFVVTRAKDAEGHFFWTSVPEGKPDLAAAIGSLIEEQIKP
ncbi:hypothetical protein HHL16_08335 [Pseudoflavitalea sp. G-6-1-2]|uniref:hypothetical protein n=1 Tax=Pseudoflavitalea sp. G-6-1-2 TaxID=2728841 RepID=UPI00146B8473|nr:hypothetical protein [Pseudoflavitalea sp. G-6-1-2]NML20878.1 hypothetical protein [Pseudoflavitalea sp. G-6-1-2]